MIDISVNREDKYMKHLSLTKEWYKIILDLRGLFRNHSSTLPNSQLAILLLHLENRVKRAPCGVCWNDLENRVKRAPCGVCWNEGEMLYL
jgi:hypothetical protein